MYSKTPTGKASKGSVSVAVSNGRLQLVFRYGGKRHYLSVGLADTPEARKLAEMKARTIELDILSGNFDQTLEKYKPQRALAVVVNPEEVTTKPPQPNLKDLWQGFLEYKRPQCSPSTMKFQYSTFTRYLENLPTHDLDRANDIRDHILKAIPVNSAKRFIVRLSACCTWAMESGLIQENPFQGMASQVKLPKSAANNGMGEIDPFTASERDAIIEAFRDNLVCSKYSRVKHSHYYPFTFFLFNTGCRPSEAIALEWRHISKDFRWISFEQAVVEGENGSTCKQGLKTQERRRFPCNAKMQAFLSSIKPTDCKPDQLVFPSPEGKWIDTNNFRNRIWTPVLEKLGIEYRKTYQTRHTFITLALENGLDAKDVARLVGNSPQIIYEHYAGNKRDLCVPEF